MEGLVHSKEGLISIARHSLFCFPEYQEIQHSNFYTFVVVVHLDFTKNKIVINCDE